MKRVRSAKVKTKTAAAPKAKPRAKPSASNTTSAPTHADLPVFCADLKRRRGELGMTLDQLAERAKLTPNYIGTIENGYRDPSLSTLSSLADGLGVPLGELFGPARPVSHSAMDMAALFNDASEDLQAAVLKLLHALTSKSRP